MKNSFVYIELNGIYAFIPLVHIVAFIETGLGGLLSDG